MQYFLTGHSPRGECGLKCYQRQYRHAVYRHSPRGECGLKSDIENIKAYRSGSLPARGVWVEIVKLKLSSIVKCVTPREGSVG